MTKEERQANRKSENAAFKESLKNMTKEEKKVAKEERKKSKETNQKNNLIKNEEALSRRKNVKELAEEENKIWKQIFELIN